MIRKQKSQTIHHTHKNQIHIKSPNLYKTFFILFFAVSRVKLILFHFDLFIERI